MSKKDPTASARVDRFRKTQIERGQRECRLWVDALEFERGYALYDSSLPMLLIDAMKQSIDRAALVLGWRKAELEHLERLGTSMLTQRKLDYELQKILELGPKSVTMQMDMTGNMEVDGPATIKQLFLLARLSERVRKNGQAKN